MGSISCHHLKTQKRKIFGSDLETSIECKKPTQHIDLPYRHYITKNFYIPSALPHSVKEFNYNNKVRISKSIKQSSIMLRRFSELNQESTTFQMLGERIDI